MMRKIGCILRRTIWHSLFAVMCFSTQVTHAQSYEPQSGLLLNRAGSGEFRRFGFLVYEASLWVGPNKDRPPLALQLIYKRHIGGQQIVEASIKEMRQLGASEHMLQTWATQMRNLFPDVKPGDQITGIYKPGSATFLFNGREIGTINDLEFARYFFAIWLDPRTSDPGLRASLLGQT
ncbi:MAG: chalcone isomerase family protein [Fluviibacter sp.]